MSDIKLFRMLDQQVTELPGSAVTLEKSLQTLIERQLETFLGVRFLASEHVTGKTHGGRIDTLGIDENDCPVIIEYKRSVNENVINQGLYYLDWLMDHKAEFKLLVLERLGAEASASIDWSAPRLLCIAGDFTKYDEYAVQQINRNIDLIRYRRFGNDLLLFELVNRTTASGSPDDDAGNGPDKPGKKTAAKTVSQYLEDADQTLKDRFDALRAYLQSLGDDVQMKALVCYIAFKRIKNFACVEVHPNIGCLRVFVKVDPASLELKKGFTRDVREIGHFGTGDLEITIASDEDFEAAKPFLLKSYEAS